MYIQPLEPKTFIFRGYNPYIGGVKPSNFMVLGSHGTIYFFLRGKQLQYIFIYIPYMYIPGTQKDPCFDNDYKKTCFFEGPTPKTKDKLIAGIYAIVHEYLERKVTYFFGGVDY